jgi:ferrochelatase
MMASLPQRIGVLLMAYGGPASLADLPGYLADIRSGRPTTRAVLSEMTHNYTAIGGASPLVAHTARQIDAVGALLNHDTRQPRFELYMGMRHWAPWIEETIGRMLDSGITHAVSLVLAPHFSAMSIAKYHARIVEGLQAYRGQIDFAHIDSYHDVPGLIDPLADRVRTGLEQWPVEARDTVHVVFSAHSLPARIIATGDPYDAQVKETAALVAARAGLRADQWSWSYQSAGRSPEPWLGPSLAEHLTALAQRGIRNVVSVPVGFVCDHVEMLYDIDIAAQELAKSLQMRLERPPALNDDPAFMQQLATLIRQRAHHAGWLAAA